MDEKRINEKLNAPKKLSQFEQQRQEAEKQRIKAEVEARVALREFREAFGYDDDEGAASDTAPDERPGGSGLGEGVMRNSGPGTLGPPPPSLKRRREMEEERERRDRGPRGSGMRGFDGDYDDDDNNHNLARRKSSPDPAVRRPTMMLSQLPKKMTKDDIRKMMPHKITVEDVSFVPPTGPGSDRRHLSAIVTVAASTPMSDVDSTVTSLQSKYLGFGCYLKIHRHITSSLGGLGSGLGAHALHGQLDFQPFGAKPWVETAPVDSLRHAPPPDSLDRGSRGYQSYPQQNFRNQTSAPLVVTITPPSDLSLLQAVYKTVERVIQYGPVFEKALLSDPAVQHDESWAWIFDPASQSSLYYRWLIYEYYAARAFSSAKQGASSAAALAALQPDDIWQQSPEGQFAKKNGLVKLFDQGPLFQPPRIRPKFEFVMDLEDLVEDSGYVSSSDESGDDIQFRPVHKKPPPSLDILIGSSSAAPTSSGYLNPYRKARLTHLLARMPDAIATLRAGDVARVTNFVVNNAGSGADEIVSMMVENITTPYSRHVQYNTSLSDVDKDDDDLPSSSDEAAWDRREKRDMRRKNEEDKKRNDSSNAKLIALYLVSDALQASSTSGVRDAWKYRSLFENALRSRNVFQHLGLLDKREQWGRMKSEQWKRKIAVILGLWEKRSVFSADTHKFFRDAFLNPPLNPDEQAQKEKLADEEKEKGQAGRWKSGTSTPADPAPRRSVSPSVTAGPSVPGASEKTEQKTIPQEVDSKALSMAERLAAMKKHVKAARPTAADLLENKEEAPPPAPAPKISVGGLSLSLGAGPARGGAGFSLGAKKSAEDDMDNPKPRERKANISDMFGDSDGE